MTTETLATDQAATISWKGQQVALAELGIEQLDNLSENIEYASAILGRRLNRGNLKQAEYDKIKAGNDEVLETVKAEMKRRGFQICSECHVLLSIKDSEVCRSCYDYSHFVN